MKTYCFYTTNNTRFDVKAATPASAWHKVKSIPHLFECATGSYGAYDSEGLIATGTIHGRFDKPERTN